MNNATFSIPNRWQEGIYQIKCWIENYARTVGHPLTVNIAGELYTGQIWIANGGTLTDQQYETADNAVHILNNHLNKLGAEPWKARTEAEKELEKRLEELDAIFLR